MDKRLKFYTENSPMGVIEWDSDFVVTLWTGGAEKIFGWKTEEVVGKKIMDLNLIYEPDIPLVEETMKKLIAEKSNFLISHNRNVRKDGKIIYCVWYNTILHDSHGSMKFLLSQVLDVTERVEYEEKLVQMNAEKDQFISVLSHDLKNPFAALLNLSSHLKENIGAYQPDEIETQVKYIHESAQHTYNLLEDLLGWASLQRDMMPFRPQKLSFTEIGKYVVETLSPAANLKNIKIIHFTAEQIKVIADETMLKTILRNLVTNAIKFSEVNGVVVISAVQTDMKLTISVSDNGIGIKPEHLAKLFDSSQLFTTKGTSGEEGTGLGLPLCKELVEKHGGEIWAESEVGKGSVFFFTIPNIYRNKK